MDMREEEILVSFSLSGFRKNSRKDCKKPEQFYAMLKCYLKKVDHACKPFPEKVPFSVAKNFETISSVREAQIQV